MCKSITRKILKDTKVIQAKVTNITNTSYLKERKTEISYCIAAKIVGNIFRIKLFDMLVTFMDIPEL